MVIRPVFSPETCRIGVRVVDSPPFSWNPGFSPLQKRRNVEALHAAIIEADAYMKPLVVSNRSSSPLGVNLSAFNLGVRLGEKLMSVESVYQASKVFQGGIGPFPKLYCSSPYEVKKKIRDLGNTQIVAYQIGGVVWELNPTRAFYDWVYCRILHKNSKLVEGLNQFNCFTDIAFNPVKSLNCQAYAVALYLSLMVNGVLEDALSSKEAFLHYHPHDVVNLRMTNRINKKQRVSKWHHSDDTQMKLEI